MIPDSKMMSIALKLLERTKLNEVEWKMAKVGQTGREAPAVEFPNSKIQIELRRWKDEPDEVSFELWGPRGVASRLASDENFRGRQFQAT